MLFSKCIFNFLTVGCWNIEGIYEKINSVKVCKLNQPVFLETLHNHDILCLLETHISHDEPIVHIDGYTITPHCRKISANNRYFGGMLIFIKNSIEKGVKIGKNFDEDVLEVTLKNDFFGLNKDYKFLFTYASPINSPYTKSRPENLLGKIETKYICSEDSVSIMGDLNGKTGVCEDFIRDSTDEHSPINMTMYNKNPTNAFPLSRQNVDTNIIDEQGRLILDLCKSSDLRILNGRITGDQRGNFTRYPSNLSDKPSVIDYALCSESMIGQVKSFTVLPFSGISDHCCISLNIEVNVYNPTAIPKPIENIQLNNQKFAYKFFDNQAHIFEYAVRNDGRLENLKSLLAQTNFGIDDINRGVSNVNEILLNAAKKAKFAKRVKSNKKMNNVRPSKGWYTNECKTRQKILRRCCKELSTSPFDKNKREKFVKARADYKKICRKAETAGRRQLTNKLIEIGQNDPKLFWNTIKKMNNWGKEKSDLCDNVTTKEWIRHFENLLNDKNSPKLHIEEGDRTFNPILDRKIDLKELRQALNQLKRGKAAGPDKIIGEYLKIFAHVHENIFLNLVNIIFSEQLYPSQWVSNFLKPIYKKGKMNDPENFRGLAIGSTFAKLFSLILLNRLIKFIDLKKLISPKQIGFMKGTRTSDHIYFLQTVVEKVVKKNKKKLFAVFIDFKKAYDTVDRNILMKRLKQLGINGIYLRNIFGMYAKTEYCIKLKRGYTCPIDSNLGLKQGCPLSPMLFNLYIDDIDKVFDDTCDPITIQTEKLSHFLYADDLVILSQSKEGLQKCLNRVFEFSESKHLTISATKSKTMVFNTSGKFIKELFTLNGKALEPVQSFCYLGFDVKCSGNVTHAMHILNDKGNKALKPLLTAIRRFNIPFKTSIRLFHTFISPILLYNAENWTTLSDSSLQKFDRLSLFSMTSETRIDITHRKFLKNNLGVSRSCPTLAVYGETGELPISLKGYRFILNYWYRVTNLPDTVLAKKALLENIELRTNWIITIEKLIGAFNLADKVENYTKFNSAVKKALEDGYLDHWIKLLRDPSISRLNFYTKLKTEFGIEKFLDTLNFEQRRAITKLRCSDHSLEIEKGRHKGIKDRSKRLCPLCPNPEMEDEEHFIFSCKSYSHIRLKYGIMQSMPLQELFRDTYCTKLAKYVIEALDKRDLIIRSGRGWDVGGEGV